MQNLWRVLLPGLAFQGVLVGGGYATGRELISFYGSSGPIGGLLAMLITALIWSLAMMIILELARRYRAYDYQTFFKRLIGPGWILFDLAYMALLVVVLSIVGAAAGEIVGQMTDFPQLVGTIILIGAATAVLFMGAAAVKRVLSYWSIVLYMGYIGFFVLFMTKLGDLSLSSMAASQGGADILINGIRYAGVNINCFVSILFLVAMLQSRKEALVSGALVGPIAIVPAMLFYFAMMAFYPTIQDEAVPLNYLLERLAVPAFELIFQLIILGTLLQTGVGMLHALNGRVEAVYVKRDAPMPAWLRASVALFLMVFSVTVAEWIGLVKLIDRGYGLLSWVFVLLIFAPVFTVGLYLIVRESRFEDRAKLAEGRVT